MGDGRRVDIPAVGCGDEPWAQSLRVPGANLCAWRLAHSFLQWILHASIDGPGNRIDSFLVPDPSFTTSVVATMFGPQRAGRSTLSLNPTASSDEAPGRR